MAQHSLWLKRRARRAIAVATLAVFIIGAAAPPIWGPLKPGPHFVGITAEPLPTVGSGARAIIWWPTRTRTKPLSIAELAVLICGDAPDGVSPCLADTQDQLKSAGFAGSQARFRDLTRAPVFAGTLAALDYRKKLPVVLLEGSRAGLANDFIILAEFLASWGYVVVSVNDASLAFPGYTAERARQRASAIRETLRLLASKSGADTDRIGTVAWSFGGVVVPLAADGDDRFRAEVSFDSAVNYSYGGAILRDAVPGVLASKRCRPLLHLLPAETNTVAKDDSYVGSSGTTYRATLPGYSHASFNDQRGVMAAFARGGEDWSRFASRYSSTAQAVRTFFDAYVKGDGSALRALDSILIGDQPVALSRDPACR